MISVSLWFNLQVPNDPRSSPRFSWPFSSPPTNRKQRRWRTWPSRSKPSLCVVTTRGREANREGLGTGFVISADGLIATNAHVIGEGRPIAVEFADGKKYDATVVHAHDLKRDLAIIKIDAKDLKPLALGDSDKLKDGQAVIAFGNPKGLKYSVVGGVVSAVREVEGRKMIQLAVPVEPGNSGGPLVDMQGRVQGIVTLKSLGHREPRVRRHRQRPEAVARKAEPGADGGVGDDRRA